MANIRKYKPSDREVVENISYNTGFMGSSLNKIFEDKKLWLYFVTKYYFDKAPENIYVLEDNKRIVGYLFGCLDDRDKEKFDRKTYFNIKTAFGIFLRYFSSSNNQKYMIKHLLFNFRKETLPKPRNSGHLHINLLPESRGRGAGGKLLNSFLRYAKSKGVKRIHADAYLSKERLDKNFWVKNKFEIFSKVKTYIWKRQLPNEEMYHVCFVKTI